MNTAHSSTRWFAKEKFGEARKKKYNEPKDLPGYQNVTEIMFLS